MTYVELQVCTDTNLDIYDDADYITHWCDRKDVYIETKIEKQFCTSPPAAEKVAVILTLGACEYEVDILQAVRIDNKSYILSEEMADCKRFWSKISKPNRDALRSIRTHPIGIDMWYETNAAGSWKEFAEGEGSGSTLGMAECCVPIVACLIKSGNKELHEAGIGFLELIRKGQGTDNLGFDT